MERDSTVEIGQLSDLLYSKTFHRLLQKRKDYLQKEVNRYVREQNWYSAYGAVMKLDDLDKLVEIMIKTLQELKNE